MDSEQVQSDETPEVEVEQPEPTEVSLRDALEWNEEERGELPEQFSGLPRDDIRALLDEERAQIATQERERWARIQAEEERVRQANQRRLADENENITWLEGLRERLQSGNEEDASAAAREIAENEERYTQAAATAQAMSRQQRSAEAWRELLSAGHREMAQAGFSDFMPDPTSAEFGLWARETLAPYDSKGGVFGYAVEYGKRIGYDDGYAAGKEAGERDARISAGLESPPAEGQQMGSNGDGVTLARYQAMTPAQRAEFRAAGKQIVDIPR